jgi:hypothetical protein
LSPLSEIRIAPVRFISVCQTKVVTLSNSLFLARRVIIGKMLVLFKMPPVKGTLKGIVLHTQSREEIGNSCRFMKMRVVGENKSSRSD